MRSRVAAVLLLAGVIGAVPALAQTVTVEQPWARATAPHAATGAVYATLTAGVADRLTGASSPVAAQTGVHETVQDNGVMRMRPVTGGLALAAGKKIALAPGGYHLMMTGLKRQLRPGESFPLTLSFANEPAVTVDVTVATAGAAAAPMGPMPMP